MWEITLQYYEKTANFKAHAPENVEVVVDLKLLGVVDELQPIILKSVHDNLSKGSEIQGYPNIHIFYKGLCNFVYLFLGYI